MKQTLLFFLFGFFTFFGFSQVVANRPPDVLSCDDDGSNDGVYEFNLNYDDVIIGNQTNVFVMYFQSSWEAEYGNESNSVYNVKVFLSTTIYARVENYVTGEYAITSFSLYVKQLPGISDQGFMVCDDETADGISTFNLDRGSGIKYYETFSDADNDINELPSVYTNTTPYSQTLYARKDNGECYNIVPRVLRVEPFPDFTTPETYEVCESDSDGVSTFYLEYIQDKILADTGNNVSFYETLENAQSGNISKRLPLEYQNTSNPQTIYVRAGSSCYTIKEMELLVNNANPPKTNDLPVQFFCPNEIGIYDLTIYEPQLVDNVSNLTFSYYNSFVEMLAKTNEIENPTGEEFTYGVREIFVRIDDNLSSCYSFTSMFFDFTAPCEVVCDETYNLSFCQSRNDITYSFYNASGSPLTLEISKGTIDTFGFDSGYIIVRDSDGTELYNGNGNPTSKNRVNSLAGLVFQSTGSSITFELYSLINACDDDPEVYIPLDINVYCSENVGLLKLSAFLDDNANSIFDLNEPYYSQGIFSYEKNGDGRVAQIVSSTGQATVVVDNPSDVYEVSYELFEDSRNCFSSSISLFNNVSVSTGSTNTVGFPIIEEDSCEDLAVSLINYMAPPRPGFVFNNYLVLENLGVTTIESGTIEFLCDPRLVINQASSDIPNYVINRTTNGFTLDFENLQPGVKESIKVSLICPSGLELGEIVTNTSSYITDDNDNYVNNNYSAISQTIVGSYDPNDIFESHGPKILHSEFTSEDYLYYTIRFQNVGTASAINISIDNSLLESGLDESTVQLLDASHDYTFTKSRSRLNWKFNNIHLPSEEVDEPASHGYVSYKVKPLTGYSVGDVIPNTAKIYFDYNEAIVTNTFETEFVEAEALSNSNFENLKLFVFPNPAKNHFYLQLNEQVNSVSVEVTIVDLRGKEIIKIEKNNTGKSIKLDISQLKGGLYFVKVTYGNETSVRKLIVE